MQRGGEVSEHRDVCEGFSDQPASTGGAGPRLRPWDEHLQEGQRTIIQSFHSSSEAARVLQENPDANMLI